MAEIIFLFERLILFDVFLPIKATGLETSIFFLCKRSIKISPEIYRLIKKIPYKNKLINLRTIYPY